VSAKAGDTLGVQLIKAAGAGTAIGDQARVFEHAQVLRDSGTADRKLASQFVDGDGSGRELLEDGHSGRVAQGIESGL
jgi:hypothetical protein